MTNDHQTKNVSAPAALNGRLVRVVRQALTEQSLPGDIAVEADLYDAGLTSFAMVRLMLAVEVEFDISIPDVELHPDNFRSIKMIGELVARLQV